MGKKGYNKILQFSRFVPTIGFRWFDFKSLLSFEGHFGENRTFSDILENAKGKLFFRLKSFFYLMPHHMALKSPKYANK